MVVEAVSKANRLVGAQRQAADRFFGPEAPFPSDRLFEVAEKIREEKLLEDSKIIYLPKRQLAKGLYLPGQNCKLRSDFYSLMKDGMIAGDADWLPGMWVIIDTTRRPRYVVGGKQMYPDTSRFMEMMADLRDQGKIKVPSEFEHVPKPSRFAVSPDEIDGRGSFVAKEVADVLGLKKGEEVTTLSATTFNYVGNLHQELGFGAVNTDEWFSNKGKTFVPSRLYGGNSAHGGLSRVILWCQDPRSDSVGFRLQIGFPARVQY